MTNEKRGTGIKVLAAITFVLMITVNALGDILPINGVTTGQVSDSYENLFAPAGITFAIWGLIYFLTAGYTLYQLGVFRRNSKVSDEFLSKVSLLFSVSSIANALWIISWHYDLIGLSMILMLVILVCLILISREINKTELSKRDKYFIKIPFSIYLAWISVAVIANASAFLVSLGWNGFGVPEVWTVIMIAAGLIIGMTAILKNKDAAFGLVIAWAYAGILIKHLSQTGFGGEYPSVISAAIVSIAAIIISIVFIFISGMKNKK